MLSAIVVSFVLGADRLYGCGGLSAGTATLIGSLSNSISQPYAQKATLRGVSADVKSWQSGIRGIEPPGQSTKPSIRMTPEVTDETVRLLIMH
jgi:hypothetical protein